MHAYDQYDFYFLHKIFQVYIQWALKLGNRLVQYISHKNIESSWIGYKFRVGRDLFYKFKSMISMCKLSLPFQRTSRLNAKVFQFLMKSTIPNRRRKRMKECLVLCALQSTVSTVMRSALLKRQMNRNEINLFRFKPDRSW